MNESSRGTMLALVGLLLAPVFGLSQSPPQSVTVKVNGSSGDARAVQINGKSYVDIESLARITNGSISFHGNQIVLTLPVSSAGGEGSYGCFFCDAASEAGVFEGVFAGGHRSDVGGTRVAKRDRKCRAE